ncbi:serine/arginine repetitive matrix protein 1 isoform X5 [Aricia agestis]|uniref:serine/arginine repetitive matrix protein 1 isoform X5 n=1 Tax=Aricia agestis TaxID=91739 RepID=UPI001C2023EC|nr:serine/arginine repetitive matrix protein 1 isoform X5 [Aricia agestis]
MIGSFWNLCRACPSMPVDKLHSEYRSTYRWHEYREQQQQPGVVRQPAPTPPSALPIARGAMEPAMPRRKKYPGMAYKTNELFDPAPADDIRPAHSSAFDRARSAQRNETDRAGRRSKSEGPRQPRWTDTVEPKATTALGEVLAAKEPESASTEYQNQFAWPKDTTDSVPRKSISMGALKKAAVAEGSVEAEPLMNHVDGDHDDGHKKYIEDYLWNGQKPGVQRALPRDEKDGKESRNHSPKKFRSFRSAPHQSIHAKLQETKALERSPHKTSPQKQRKKLQGHSFDEGANQEGAKTEGAFKSPRRRPRSADPAPAPARHMVNGHEPSPRPAKPTEDEIVPSLRSASVAKDHFFDDSPVVKSPPEPTRVKSPEQLNMRSPDPVNWTVPLDTGKTFTVTQNVKSEIAPIHHQQMSPIRSLKKSESPTSLSKRTDKTPTTPVSLTPIDETKALDLNKVNGLNGISPHSTPESPTLEVVKKSTEATQVAPGVVDTTVVNEPSTGITAAEVLDRARTRFDKFWGKKEDDV